MHFCWDLYLFRYHSPLMRYFMVHKSTIENTCAHWINLQLLWNAHWKNETWFNVINLSMAVFFSSKLNPFLNNEHIIKRGRSFNRFSFSCVCVSTWIKSLSVPLFFVDSLFFDFIPFCRSIFGKDGKYSLARTLSVQCVWCLYCSCNTIGIKLLDLSISLYRCVVALCPLLRNPFVCHGPCNKRSLFGYEFPARLNNLCPFFYWTGSVVPNLFCTHFFIYYHRRFIIILWSHSYYSVFSLWSGHSDLEISFSSLWHCLCHFQILFKCIF